MNSRALLAAGVFIVLLVAAVLIARSDPQREEKEPTAVLDPAPPAIPAPVPPLARADLIDAAARAADAHARGNPLPPEIIDLTGRRFTVRLPFGCAGPAAEGSDAPMRWSYDAEQETLRVSVTPNVWTDSEPVRAAAAGIDYEAAEGFWITRPWLRSGDCPVLPQPAQAEGTADAEPEGGDQTSANEPAEGDAIAAAGGQAAPARETLALVELFSPGSRRAAQRNGKPYAVVARLAPGAIDLSRGLRLVVSGRLVALGTGGSFACSGRNIDDRPLCIIGTQIERVAITDAAGQQTLSEWNR